MGTMGKRGVVLLQRVLFLLGLGALVIGACASEGDCEEEVVDGVCQKPCDDSECTPGARCVNNACSATCSSHGDCGSRRYCLGVRLDDGDQGRFCVCLGAVVDGVCSQRRCDEAECPKDWRCLENACSAPCTSNLDCPVGTNCLRAAFSEEDGSVTQGSYCAPTAGGQGTPCSTDVECDVNRGWRCFGGTCRVTCATHRDCGNLGSCSGEAEDGAGNTQRWCAPDGEPRAQGQYGSACPNGDADCDDEAGFFCVGFGPGDLDAYCTRSLCAADGDCPSGYQCAAARTGRPPCQDACGFEGTPTNQRCVKPEEIGEGREFRCGPLTLVRNVCVLREFCSECETDADCRGKPNQICARDSGGQKICTVLCDPDINSCPWGNAAVCDVWDTELGVPTCSHRFGSCKGTGKGCEPCVDENDCGTNGLCLSSNFTHERYCIDLDASCDACPPGEQTCPGNGCPQTPGGLNTTCYGGIPAQEALYRKCVGANVNESTLESPQVGCWPAL
jgi:hypothetical protein